MKIFTEENMNKLRNWTTIMFYCSMAGLIIGLIVAAGIIGAGLIYYWWC